MYLPNLVPEENSIVHKNDKNSLEYDSQYQENPLNSFYYENNMPFSNIELQNYKFMVKNSKDFLSNKSKEKNIQHILQKKTFASLISESSIQSDSFDALLKNGKHNKTASLLPEVNLNIESPTKINDLIIMETPIFGGIPKIDFSTFIEQTKKSRNTHLKRTLSIHHMNSNSKEGAEENNSLFKGLQRNLQTASEPTLVKQKNFKSTPQLINGFEKSVTLARTRSKISCLNDVKNERLCKICLDDEETQNMGKLITPCQCSGSVRFVHDECLKTWIISKKMDLEKTSCELCKIKFTMKIAYTLKFYPKLILQEGLMSFLSCICLSILLIILFAIIGYVVTTWYNDF